MYRAGRQLFVRRSRWGSVTSDKTEVMGPGLPPCLGGKLCDGGFHRRADRERTEPSIAGGVHVKVSIYPIGVQDRQTVLQQLG